MEYPGIQSAFEVFSSKFAKNKKGNTSKTPSPPGGKARVSPARQESAKFKATQNMNGAGLVQITNGAVVAKKKRRKIFATNNGLVDQKKDVINKKRNSTSGTNDMGVVEQLGEQVEIAIATKNKKTKVSLKSKRKLSLLNGSLEKSFEEESVVELPIDKLENYNDLKILTPGPKKKRKVSGETISSNKSTATVKLQKSTRVLENGMLKETKKQKKGRKELKRKSGDAAESPSMSEAKCPDSVEEGEQLFAWLIDPVTPVDFFRDTWEQRPLVIKRQQPDFYQSLLSTAIIHKMLERDNVQFSKNVDVTTYQNGKRETHNPDGRAFPAVVWSHYNVGCSVRLLNPQTFIPKLHLLNATLQEYFGCLVGANAYLTPPGSQGFAPHYDDIEAFILQLEGQKSWKLYAPMTEDEVLPRFSSNNLSEETIGEPIMEVVLSPGDLLYFPRGTIHQGRTVTDHSLHVTLSCYQRNTWGDLLQKAISAALKYALEEDVELRRGLPRDYLRYMGSVHSDRELPERQAFVERLHGLLGRMFDQLPVDAAADQLGKQFVHDALPPVLTPAEKRCSVFGDGLKMMEKGRLCNHGELELKTKIKLLRAHILRLVVEEEDVVRLYHYVDNSLEYHGNEPQYLELPVEAAPAVELLIRSYPAFVAVASLPLDTDDDKVKLAGDLWERGLLLTDRPLQVVVDE